MIDKFYLGKKVLVTGHTGFKGSWLVQTLLQIGATVCGISLKPNTSPSLFDLLELESSIDSNIIDVRDYDSLIRVFNKFQPEIVFHLAAQPLVIESYENPKYTYETNILGTVNICECVRITKSVKSFINVTTDKVYDNIEDNEYHYKENDNLNGHDPYSNSKSCSDIITQSYIKCFFKNNIAVSICRAGNVIGGGDFSNNRIIPDCIRYTLENKSILIRNPNSIRPYQHVLEADIFYLTIAMKQYNDKSLAGIYNIGPNDLDCIRTGDVASIFVEAWGEPASWSAVDYKGVHEANFLKLDSSKAHKYLNWFPRWSVKQSIYKTVEWTKVYQNSGNIIEITKRQIEEYLWEK